MQALPAFASDFVAVDNKPLDFTKSFSIYLGSCKYSGESTYLYYTPVNQTINSDNGYYSANLEAGQLYVVINTSARDENYTTNKYTKLGDAKSILGGSSSSGLSEEQKTIIKDLIANWPGLCRLVEKFFERNDDNDEYEKKT